MAGKFSRHLGDRNSGYPKKPEKRPYARFSEGFSQIREPRRDEYYTTFTVSPAQELSEKTMTISEDIWDQINRVSAKAFGLGVDGSMSQFVQEFHEEEQEQNAEARRIALELLHVKEHYIATFLRKTGYEISDLTLVEQTIDGKIHLWLEPKAFSNVAADDKFEEDLLAFICERFYQQKILHEGKPATQHIFTDTHELVKNVVEFFRNRHAPKART